MTNMPSALRPSGSTSAWRKIRAAWEPHVATGTIRCRRCHRLIPPGTRWQLGHPEHAPRALGGDDTDLWPEHEDCGIKAGAKLGGQRRHANRHPQPSRTW